MDTQKIYLPLQGVHHAPSHASYSVFLPGQYFVISPPASITLGIESDNFLKFYRSPHTPQSLHLLLQSRTLDTGHWTYILHPPSILHPSILEMSQRDNLVLLIHLRFIGLPGRHPAGPADRQTDRDTGQGHSETRTQREEAGESSRSHRVRAVTELASGECVCLVAADRCVIVSASNRGFLKPTGKSILPLMVG